MVKFNYLRYGPPFNRNKNSLKVRCCQGMISAGHNTSSLNIMSTCPFLITINDTVESPVGPKSPADQTRYEYRGVVGACGHSRPQVGGGGAGTDR